MKKIIKYVIYALVFCLGFSMAFSIDPEVNWIMKLLGLGLWIYWCNVIIFKKT